jgi:1-acyl-sn-glycerol-3-phosphate acyltransferase
VSAKKNPYPAQIVIEAIRLVGWTISRLLWRIEFRGVENIPQDLPGGLVVMANHQTYLDPMWICLKINRKYRFMAWDAVFDWFFVGKAIRYLGAFPVNMEGGSIKAMKEALRALRDGATLIIFPEGEREFSDGEFLEFKSGAMRIAMEAGVPILPVTISGAHKIWAQDMKLPRFTGKVKLTYHPLFYVPKPEKGTDLREHIERLTEELKKVINEK